MDALTRSGADAAVFHEQFRDDGPITGFEHAPVRATCVPPFGEAERLGACHRRMGDAGSKGLRRAV